MAPFTFPIYKDNQQYENEKREVIKSTKPIFIDSTVELNNKDKINNFFQQFQTLLQDLNKRIKKTKPLNEDTIFQKGVYVSDVFIAGVELEKLFITYRQNTTNFISVNFTDFIGNLKTNLIDISSKKIINAKKDTISSKEISIKKHNQKYYNIESLDKVIDIEEARASFDRNILPFVVDEQVKNFVLRLRDIFIKENLYFDKALTELEIQSKIAQIPKTVGIVLENERIISKHDPINKLTKLKLDSYKKIRLENLGVQDILKQYVGKILMSVLFLSILTIFLTIIRKRVFSDNSKITLILSLIFLESFFAYISIQIKIDFPIELLIFLPVSAILLTILFDSRLAFFVQMVIIMITASIRGGDFSTGFIAYCGSVLAIFSVRDIKNRSQIFRSAIFIFIGYSLSIIALGMDKIQTESNIFTDLIFAIINSVMSPIIAYGLLIFYERTFKITTDLTLLELADFNHPLLKKLSTVAPGTFHHSVIMANLAEAAAEAIGANRILTRVGCYYHDIGKILKPEYYVENQIDKKSKHEKLNPTISAKVIISHVKEGIELAKEYKLPQEVIDFIPMHHGTTLVSYFYQKAKNVVDEEKEDISDYIYRYPGPKPQTKETGIVMLADTIEAATRTIEEPTPGKLEDKIDEIIKKRFIEGELDECELTLKDLSKIKLAFLKILVGIHHQRIKYPEEKTDE
ncbi:MAG: HDIG domain-containing protein [Ignavibacteria bacterium]|nr:HDIG domain-containing protein [Ignavibacteria bacterium]